MQKKHHPCEGVNGCASTFELLKPTFNSVNQLEFSKHLRARLPGNRVI